MLCVAVEASIAAGKTTLLQALAQFHGVKCFTEPIGEWCSFLPNCNGLEKFYAGLNGKGPAWSFQFQVLVSTLYAKHLRKVCNTENGDGAKIIFLERSIFASLLFARNLLKKGMIDEAELKLLESMVEGLSVGLPTVDAVVYLRCSPKESLARVERRGREEEVAISPQYLEELHRSHEDWHANGFHPLKPKEVFVVNADTSDANSVLSQVLQFTRTLGIQC